jgi:cobalt-zinc-cadmium efflux system membrane fusion protein
MRLLYKTRALSFIWCLIASLLFGTGGCRSKENPEKVDPKLSYVLPDSMAKRIEIDTVSKSNVINSINLTGKITYNDEHIVKIFPLISGVAQDIKVMLGDYVQKGQALAVIKSSEMAGYSTDLITASTNLKVSKKNLDAAEDMYNTGLTSSRDYLAAQSSYEQAKSALTKAQKILSINGGGTDGSFIVRAPISGFVVEKMLTNSTAIRGDNSSNLFTISDLKNVWVVANVYESNISFIKSHDDVDVTTISYPDKVFHGKVDKIMNVLDPVNKVMKVRIDLPNPDYLLKPEMFATVTVNSKSSGNEMLSIPTGAVIFDNSEYFVLVYKSNKDISIRPIKIASTAGNKTYVSDGLVLGERVIGTDALLIYQQLNN